jgi:hypothetical protein
VKNLPSGTYTVTVTVTDANNCTDTDSAQIKQPSQKLSILHSQKDVSCFAGSDGWIKVTPLGGISPYTFEWSNGKTSDTINNLSQGYYYVTVKDNNGCDADEVIEITQPNKLIVSINKTKSISCYGKNDGELIANVTGGTENYTYKWNNDTTKNIKINTNLNSGNYKVTVEDANKCKDTASYFLGQPSQLTSSVVSQTNVLCWNEATGSVKLSASGGTGNYTFKWSDRESGDNRINLQAGIYIATITDNNNCSITHKVTITEPPMLILYVDDPTNASCYCCNDGISTVSADGGTPPYTFEWSHGDTGDTVKNLEIGTYWVTVYDKNRCSENSSVEINSETEPLNGNFRAIKHVSCYGGSDGEATVYGINGVPSYYFSWSGGGNSAKKTGLKAGKHWVTITDSKGCTFSTNITITQPSLPLSSSFSNKIDVSCFGDSTGSVTVTASGGTPSYTYLWSNGCSLNINSNLTAEKYFITVTDAKSCTKIDSITIKQPAKIILNIDKKDVTCKGGKNGAATVTATGGAGDYTYLWSNGVKTAYNNELYAGSYSVTVKDKNSCSKDTTIIITEPSALSVKTDSIKKPSCIGYDDGYAKISVNGGVGNYSYKWSCGGTTNEKWGLKAGNYSITITDGNSCSIDYNLTISPPDTIKPSIHKTDVSCFGGNDGTIIINVTGGTGNINYKWNDGFSDSQHINLRKNNYSVTVTDANSCDTVLSNIIINEPDKLTANISISNVSCNGGSNGSINVNVTGGTPDYSYLWNNGNTDSIRENLKAGQYKITVSDSKNCKDSTSIQVTEPDELQTNIISQNVTCNGYSDGSALVYVTGGTPTYDYTWSNGIKNQENNNLKAGKYLLTVVDNLGCSAIDSVIIYEPDSLKINSIEITKASCAEVADGMVLINASGGSVPYEYKIGERAFINQNHIKGLSSGLTNLIVKDSNGCIVTQNIEIGANKVMTLIDSLKMVTCAGFNDGYLNVNGNGGTGNYNYSIDSGLFYSPLREFNLPADTYKIITKDILTGCKSDVYKIFISEPEPIKLNTILIDSAACGQPSGKIGVNIAGGSGDFSESWYALKTNNPVLSPLSVIAGSYKVIISDNNSTNCIAIDTIEVPDRSGPQITGIDILDSTWCDKPLGKIKLISTGSYPPFKYSINNKEQASDIFPNLTAGTYNLAITDRYNCKSEVIYTLKNGSAINPSYTALSATCGQADGKVTLSTSGGVPPYRYKWNDSVLIDTTSNPIMTNLRTGIYFVDFIDSKGCISKLSVNVGNSDGPKIYGLLLTKSYCGLMKGKASASVINGTKPYSYTWTKNGDNTILSIDTFINNISAGKYQLSIKDATGCSTNEEFIILDSVELEPTLNLLTYDSSSCSKPTGALTVKMMGGLTPYSYKWSNNDTNAYISNITAGLYSVTATDAKGCVKNLKINMLDKAEPYIVLQSKSEPECKKPIGKISITAVNGDTPYTYFIDDENNQNGLVAWDSINNKYMAKIENLPARTLPYNISVLDAKGCVSNQIQVKLTDLPDMEINILSLSNPLCYGSSDGTAKINVKNGIPPFKYTWTGSNDNKTDVNTLKAGLNSVVVTDTNGCIAKKEFILTQPDSIFISNIIKTMPTCAGYSDGSIDITVNGGTFPHSYLWSNGKETKYINDLSSGDYSITITDINGCKNISSINLPARQPISISLIEKTIPLCYRAANGIIEIKPSGGVGQYKYKWSNGQTSAKATNLSAGTYEITVEDNNNCRAVSSFILDEPAELKINNIEINQPLCNGNSDGSIKVVPSGGTGEYNYLWSGGKTTQGLANLKAGNYSVTVTDKNYCSVSQTIILDEPEILRISSETVNNPLCNGSDDGSINITVSGGIKDYLYLWSDNQKTNNPVNLTAGNYFVTITDKNGCLLVKNYKLTQPSPLFVSNVTSSLPLCNGGSDGNIEISVSGGTKTYLFKWSNGANTSKISDISSGYYTVTITDNNLCVLTQKFYLSEPPAIYINNVIKTLPLCAGNNNGSIGIFPVGGTGNLKYLWSNNKETALIENLSKGEYTVTITDENNCKFDATILLPEPDQLIITSITKQEPKCNGSSDGKISINIAGGSGDYSYKWSNNSNNRSIEGINSGNYSVTITDKNNCLITENITLTEPEKINITASIDNVLCPGYNNGKIVVNSSGGTGKHYYHWSNNVLTNYNEKLKAGDYSITVSDENGCYTSKTYTVTQPNNIIFASVDKISPSCSGMSDGSISVKIEGGTSPYSYLWSNNNTTSNPQNLSADNYFVTITDFNGCRAYQRITLPGRYELSVNKATFISPSCDGKNDGSIEISVTGGAGSYKYKWSNNDTSNIVTNLAAGDYSVTIYDINGCFITKNYNLPNTSPVNIELTKINNPLCSYSKTGYLEVTAYGGNGKFDYIWSGGQTTSAISGLEAGNYTVTATDAKGCNNSKSFKITSPSAISIGSKIINTPTCYNYNNGSVTLVPIGGKEPYIFKWYDNSSNNKIENLPAGEYAVTITDNNNCSVSDIIKVVQPAELSAKIINSKLPTCYKFNDGYLEILAEGGTGFIKYQWENKNNTNKLSNIGSGVYWITLTDANNCKANLHFALSEPDPIDATVIANDPKCYGICNGSIEVKGKGGTGKLSYLWSNNVKSDKADNLCKGKYSITITDENNCKFNFDVNLKEPDKIIGLDIPEKAVVCKNEKFTVSPVIKYPYYSWTSDVGFTSDKPEIEVSKAGNYFLKAITENGCEVIDTFTLVVLNKELIADFLMTSEAYLKDTVVLVEISWPKPEAQEWYFPEASRQLLSANDNIKQLIFDKTGEYYIEMKVKYEECTSYKGKYITILENNKPEFKSSDIFGAKPDLIKDVRIMPNPASNDFYIYVDLEEESPVFIEIMNMWGMKYKQLEGAGKKTYLFKIDANNYLSGQYLVKVIANTEIKTKQLIIIK